jgi:F-type H+-transporting ATPase subunit a
VSRWQVALEVIVTTIRDQIAEVGADRPGRYLPFIGTLFLFIATANVLAVVPGYQPPTGSLSTTVALAVCVLVAVPLFSIGERGLGGYLRSYLRPTPLMLPFNLIGEASRTIALAVRLYGNVMSGTVIVGILISVAPFFFPVVMQVLGLLTGLIQAYIFAILAMVYIGSASRTRRKTENPSATNTGD